MPAAAAQKTRIIYIKKKGGHGGHHGGAWKVAYADFVTAMMALFIVLWLLTQADSKLKSEIAQYFRDPGVMTGGRLIGSSAAEEQARRPKVVTEAEVLESARRAAASEQEVLQAEARRLEKALDREAGDDRLTKALREQVQIKVTDEGLTIQVIDRGKDLLFDVSSADLKPQLVKLLKTIARALGQLPNPVQIEGHTDSRQYVASHRSNWDLSFERADNARRVLENNGLREGQVERVLAYADSDPLVPDRPDADENRRLSIVALRRSKLPAAAAPAK